MPLLFRLFLVMFDVIKVLRQRCRLWDQINPPFTAYSLGKMELRGKWQHCLWFPRFPMLPFSLAETADRRAGAGSRPTRLAQGAHQNSWILFHFPLNTHSLGYLLFENTRVFTSVVTLIYIPVAVLADLTINTRKIRKGRVKRCQWAENVPSSWDWPLQEYLEEFLRPVEFTCLSL